MPFWSFLALWLKIGFLGIGGPANQIGLIHREIVEKRNLISEESFQAGLSFCLLLPGPEAQQLAVYSGWLTHGLKGALSAGAAFVLPGLLIMVALCAAYVHFGADGLGPDILIGLKASVSFFLLEAIVRLGRKTIRDPLGWMAAAFSLGLTAGLHIAFFWIAPGLALIWLVIRLVSGRGHREPVSIKLIRNNALSFCFYVFSDDKPAATSSENAPGRDAAPLNIRHFTQHSLKTFAFWGALWALPSLVLGLIFGRDMILTRLSMVMTGAAGLSFGGAYAAIAQAAQSLRGDLAPPQILDGIGLSEITPGPLVLGLVFMSFVAAYQAAPEPVAWLWAFGAAGIGTYVIFVPSYMWILWGAPFIEPLTRLEGLKRLFNLIACAALALIALMAWQFITAYLTLMTPGTIPVYMGSAGLDLKAAGLIVVAAALYFLSRRSHLITLAGLCIIGLGSGLRG